jgi:hypothetical protein
LSKFYEKGGEQIHMKRISFFLLAILFITLIHPPIVIALELAETSETTTDESEASPTAENAEVGSTEDTLSENETNQSETPNEPYEPIKPFNGYETETIWGNYRNDSRFSIDLVKVTHHSIDANYRVKHEGPNFGEILPINLQYGYLIPSIFGDPFAFQTRLGSGDFFRNYVVTDLPPASPIFLTLSTPRIDNEGMIYVAGARQLVITAGNPSIGSTELKEISTNKATISQSLNTARNNSDYRPVKFEVRISNQNNWTQQTLTYTNGLELFSETASQFTTQFELPNLMANTEYSVTTRLTTGDSFSTANQLTSEWSTPIIIKTDQVTSTDLEVIAKPADVLLGTPVESLDPNSLVEVKLDGVTLPASEYTCVLSNIPSIETRTTGNTIAQVRVTRRGQSKTASVPLTVKWGSTIQHNGTFQTADMKDQERIIGTYTWHQGLGIRYSPFTLSAGGQYPLSEAGTNNTIEITSISVFSGAQDFRLGSANATSTFVTRGNSLSYNLESSYNAAYPSGFIPATVGDVVESRHIYRNNQVLSASTISNRIWQGLRTDAGFTDPTGGLNSTYYEITAGGFRLLVVNQTRGIDTELAAGTTRAQLDARINNFVDLPQGVQVKGFETYPDLENTGTSTGRILVEETLQSGKKVQIVVSVNFERLPAVTISAKPTDILLGTPVGSIDPKDLVEVKQDGVTVPKSDYTSTLTNAANISTQTVGNLTAQVRVTYNGQTETLSVPLTVKWGSSIQLYGSLNNMLPTEERVLGAYTWHPSESGISYVAGVTGLLNHRPFYHQVSDSNLASKLSVYSGTQDIKIGSSAIVREFSMDNMEAVSNAINRYAATYPNLMPVSIGDVVESHHRFKNNEVFTGQHSSLSNRIWQGLRVNEELTNPARNINSIFYEMTAEGFRPLVVNQATGIDTELAAGTTRAQLDARINNFVDLPQGVQAKSFETYPDLENTGTSTGRIVVEETLQSGKKIQTVVSVNFELLSSVEFSAKPTDILLGTPVGMIDSKSLVEVKNNGATVPASEYTSEILNPASIETRTVGNPTAQVRVTYNEQTETISVPLTVKWGSSIQHNGTYDNAAMKDQERIIGTYTWHPGLGIRYSPFTLTAMGQFILRDISINNATTITSLSVFSGGQDIKLGSTNAATTFESIAIQTPSIIQSNYNSTYGNGFIPAEIGDVVRSYHILKNNEILTGNEAISNRIWQGLRTDDGFTDSTGGLINTYYEITAEGFSPLVVNQARGIDTELEAGTTYTQLDARINDFVELPQGVQAIRFETYPNLDSGGISTGQILVEETLQSGRKIQCLIPVDFDVTPVMISVKLPVSMLFHTDNVTGANVPITSQSYRIQNDSDIPVGISRTDIVNARNYSNIHKLNFTSTDVQGSAWENIITNGVLSPSDSQQVRLEVGQTTMWTFSGTATVFEEINPYLEMVFTVSAIN